MREFNVFRGVQVGGLVRFDWGHEKKMALKGQGSKEKILGLKEGVSNKIPLSFAVMASVIMQTAYQKDKNQHF